jgi:ribose/xylose/arabinose/galactoside ABC-type transport system permease subunit
MNGDMPAHTASEASNVSSRSNLYTRMTPPLRRRVWFLVAGNLALAAYIFWYTQRTENASFQDELTRIGSNVAPLLLAGLGLTGIIATGAIDLSIGAIIVVAGTVFGILYNRQFSPAVCFAACFVTPLVLSALNGYFIRLLRIPAIIVTLAGLTFYRGLAISIAEWLDPASAEQFTIRLPQYQSPGKDWAGWIMLATLVGALAWEAFGKTSRTWLALGNSPTACRLKGLRDGRILQSSFLAGGFFLGLAALTKVTNQLTLEPARLARGFELDVIGGVVLGGTNIFGGEGSYLGTALGVFFLYWVGQSLIYAGISAYWREAIQGAVIIAVIGIDCALHRKRKRMEELK